MSIIIFEKEYDGESLVDSYRDFDECFDSRFNPIMNEIPTDEYNISKGKFTVIVKWENCDE